MSKQRLSARRVRRLRDYIARNRCTSRPGLTHDPEEVVMPDPTSFGAVVVWIECRKCGCVL